MKFLTALPVYNEEKYLKAVLPQVARYAGDVLVIDDGSTDETKDMIKDGFSDNVIYIRQENKGPAAARNTGISARIVEREILWVADEDATVRWNLRNLQGKRSLRGESAGRAGAIRTDALPRGVYLLTLENSSGPSVSWHGKIILE